MIGDRDTFRCILASRGTKPLVVIGVNPSTANEDHPDPTIRRIMGFSERNGFDSFVMLNLYPQRATNFGKVHHTRDEQLHQRNLDEIRRFFKGIGNLDVLVAFGNLVEERPYLLQCFRDIAGILQEEERKVSWWQIGRLTKQGYPRHPLYARYEWGFCEFYTAQYLSEDVSIASLSGCDRSAVATCIRTSR